MLKTLLILGLSHLAWGGAIRSNEPIPMEQCWPLMEAFGLSERFPGAVAHAIHSITLEDVRHYFDQNATLDNGIPMINFDLKAQQAVLPNAPIYGYEEGFMTMGLRAVDQVLSHMDNPDFDLAHYTILERLVHVLHMHEVWEMTKMHYEKIKSNPPTDKQVCQCIKNIESNGVLKFLTYMSLKIRYPEKMYKKSLYMSKEVPESFQYKPDEEHNADDVDGNMYRFEIPKDAKKEATDGKYDWDSNLYKFGFPKDAKKEDSLYRYDFPKDAKKDAANGKYDWDSNLYKFGFPKDAKKDAANGKYDWDSNLYKFGFPKDAKKDDSLYRFEFPKDEKKGAANGKYDWDSNLYKFGFPKDAKKTSVGKLDNEKSEANYGKYTWNNNVYTFNFSKVRKPTADTDKSVSSHRMKREAQHSIKPHEPWEYKDDGVSHIKDEAVWQEWKKIMLDMESGDHYEAAMFIYCMLNE